MAQTFLITINIRQRFFCMQKNRQYETPTLRRTLAACGGVIG